VPEMVEALRLWNAGHALRRLACSVGMAPGYADRGRTVKRTMPTKLDHGRRATPWEWLVPDLSPRSAGSRVQKTGSSVYKPPRSGPERRLARSRVGPGSEPCNNPTRVVARGVARLLGRSDFGALAGC